MDLSPKGYHAQPLRRVHIPKGGGKYRALGIPTMRDRAMQALYRLALDPLAEYFADNNSYGFRKYRSVADAIAQCFTVLSRKGSARYILEGDIRSCFDEICHSWLREHIPTDTSMLKEWLESGALHNGEFLDTFEGRMICPGHSIEMAWFTLHEAKYRGGDQRLRDIGLRILEWSWKQGWDAEYGGMLYYRDAKGLPCTEYWHDMKFWWPHNETIIATLLAYHLTGDEKYREWHKLAHDWAYAHFPDTEYGEWYGYLHRDGRLSTRLKGNNWKGPFHLPRMQLYCWKLLEEMSLQEC
jgi:N-acylglucosamine 2-epimerase